MNVSASLTGSKYIKIKKACEHNLKSININIPRDQLVVITGLSGSGKSSLAFDTIYAEGQRRYIESLSSYARQFLGQMKKPDLESIEGLTPTIAIEQRTGQSTPRSTVATSTEIFDYLRVLFARAGEAHCHICKKPISSQNPQDILDQIKRFPVSSRLQLMAPLVRSRKGTHKDLLDSLLREGFSRVRIDGQIYLIDESPKLNKNIVHNLEVLIDRIVLKHSAESRIIESIELALKISDGLCLVLVKPPKADEEEEILFSDKFACPEHGTVLAEIAPRIFSFNSPYGACHSCNGLGNLLELDEDMVIKNSSLTLAGGAITAWRKCGTGLHLFYNRGVARLAKIFKISTNVPWIDLSDDVKKGILYGTKGFSGVIPNLKSRFEKSVSESQKSRILLFMSTKLCPSCQGHRLNPNSLAVTINGKNIAEIAELNVTDAISFFKKLDLPAEKQIIATPIVKVVLERLRFLYDVGLDYIKMNRSTRSLSGGEAQRIKLASQIGAKLSGVTYVLDEPTIGLHQHDNNRLLNTLRKLRDLGNTLIVVEHDEDIMLNADYLIDIGPEAGENGGMVVASGTPDEVRKTDFLTGKYLSGKLSIKPSTSIRPFQKKFAINIKNCQQNNLKNIDVSIPLGLFTCITGVSGAGKSSLINDCLANGIKQILLNRVDHVKSHQKISGVQKIEKMVVIDQSPIGRTPRSNPATYTGFFGPIRQLFATMPESLARGYQPGRFSFNVKGGRCDDCKGQGSKTIEMHFLPDVHVMCETCKGRRYNKETLSIKFKDKNIADVLAMSVSDASEFFANQRNIAGHLNLLKDMGLGYIKIGQSSTTLSGGESQRIKLCSELHRNSGGKTLYIMDEPTTGLHYHDIAKLLKIINRLVDKNNSVIVIEHNLDVIKCADWIIDLGPNGGDAGGEILVAGPPEKIAACSRSLTGVYLKKKIIAHNQ